MELFNSEVALEYLPALLRGLGITVLLTLIVIVLAGVFAIPVALARMSRHAVLRLPFELYVELIRGTPLILQLVYIFYVLPMVGIRLEPFWAAVVALTLNYTAYMSEVYRGGIKAVPRGQWMAASAIGMTPPLAFVRVILPQAFRIVTPTLGNYFISLFKDTALASVVTVGELMYAGNLVSAQTYHYFTVYTLAGALYLLAGIPASILVRHLERRASRAYGTKR